MSQQPVYNTAGTHILVATPATGVLWECPPKYLPHALERGFTLVDGPTDSVPLIDVGQTGFDPAEHNVDEVNAHLAAHADAAPGEVERVLALELAGQNRKTIVDPRQAGGTQESDSTTDGD